MLWNYQLESDWCQLAPYLFSLWPQVHCIFVNCKNEFSPILKYNMVLESIHLGHTPIPLGKTQARD
jgi:hypothetical protein